MARTAVVAGTASSVHGKVSRRQDAKDQAAAGEQARQQADQTQMVQMQAELDEMRTQQAAPQAAPAAAPGGGDVIAQLQQLADLRTQGLLDDAEFAAAKAKLLG